MADESAFPESVSEALRAGNAYRDGRTALPFITLGDDGWPHVALSSGASLSPDGLVRFPVRRGSRSWRNISERQVVTLLVAVPSIVAYVKGRGVLRDTPASATHGICTLHECAVQWDRPPSVTVRSGITYGVDLDDRREGDERRAFLSIADEDART